MSKTAFFFTTACLAVGVSAACAAEIPAAKLEMFAPLPKVSPSRSNTITAEKVALGRILYFDPRLSRSHTVSCNSCHDLAKYGVDHEPTSTGFRGQHGGRNAPTVYNAAAHFVQFWDGRAADVEAQAKGPMMNPVEMAAPNEQYVVSVLSSMPEYVAKFRRAFPNQQNPVTLDNAAKAIGAFERELMTPARWDQYLEGDKSALTDQEKAGFLTFVNAGCAACHNGALLGGNSYKKLGFAKAWPDSKDLGREQVTNAATDKLVFKVPSLRNITKTGPYFHNGSIPTLDMAIEKMSEYQLGHPLDKSDIESIATWMKTLTGRLPEELIQPPQLPKSTAQTPKAEND